MPVINSLINGIAADYISVDDRGLHYGDGIFETILYHDRRLFFWQQHYRRLARSAERLNLNCPAEAVLLEDIRRLTAGNEPASGRAYALKILLTRGVSERGYRYHRRLTSRSGNENRVVMLSEIEISYSSLLSGELSGGELYLCKQQASINESLAGLKHLNRLENVLARNEWNDEYIDGLMLDADDFVIEGSMSNLFAVKDAQLFTPELTRAGVCGVMREVIIMLAKKNNIALSFSRLTLTQIKQMDELFISNSLIGLKTVDKLQEVSYRSTGLGSTVFAELMKISETHAQNIQ